jgi:hypothetical protein
MPWVSVTGLRLHSPLRLPLFVWHAVRSMRQAKAAPGNLFAEARSLAGVQHTLTVWQSREAMRAYLRGGAHLAAMRAFPRIGTGTTCGYDAATVPSWDEALAHWRAHALPVGG